MRKVTILAALMLLAPAVSQAKTLEDLLVEKGVISKGEAQAAAGSGASKVYWNNGTRIEFPDNGFTMGVSTLIQTRYTFNDGDDDTGTPNTSSFDVNHAYLTVSGTALNEEFAYVLEGDFAGSAADLTDAYLEWRACDWAAVKMGQFKTNLGRQFNTSDAHLQFADRSTVSDYFDLGRQNGASATGNWMDGQLSLTAGVYNGESDGEGQNRSGVDTNHTGIVSVRWDPMGKMNAYEEGDVGWTEDMAVSIGASYAFADAKNDFGGGLVGTEQNLISVDANLKYQGWSLQAELFNDSASIDNTSAGDTEPTGFYVQGGYFVDAKTMEVAARYGYLDCDDGTAPGECAGNDNLNEVTVGLNYYWWAHHLKAQVNYSFLNSDIAGPGGADVNTNRWIVQLSSHF